MMSDIPKTEETALSGQTLRQNNLVPPTQLLLDDMNIGSADDPHLQYNGGQRILQIIHGHRVL